jgi:hypothetical protein
MPGSANVTVTNIVVGEAEIKIGNSNTSASSAEFETANMVSVGATQGGVELMWAPDMVDIEVDQFGDAAKIIQSKVKVTLKTTLVEATLKNLSYSWNYNAFDIGANIDQFVGTTTQTFKFGAQSVTPIEKAVQVNGFAPGSNASVTRTRKFNTKRAISFESSSISSKRAEASTFSVSFRILPVVSDTGYEYGKIIDQTA